MNHLDECTKKALAWLWDAEGMITYSHDTKYQNIHPVASLKMTDEKFIRDKQKILGIGTISIDHAVHDKDHRDSFRLSIIRKRELKKFIEAILPYLMIKKRQAELALEMQTTYYYKEKLKIAEEISKLNKRGKEANEKRKIESEKEERNGNQEQKTIQIQMTLNISE